MLIFYIVKIFYHYTFCIIINWCQWKSIGFPCGWQYKNMLTVSLNVYALCVIELLCGYFMETNLIVQIICYFELLYFCCVMLRAVVEFYFIFLKYIIDTKCFMFCQNVALWSFYFSKKKSPFTNSNNKKPDKKIVI